MCGKRNHSDREAEAAVRQGLRERLGQDRCEFSLTGITVTVEEGRVVVEAPDTFRLDRVRREARGEIVEVAAARLGAGTEVEFRLGKARPAATPALKVVDRNGNSAAAPAASQATAAGDPLPRRGRRFERLDTMVVSEGNRIAFDVAASLGGRLGRVSPILFHGPPGCGKTHLLEGIWAVAKKRRVRVAYLAAEQFTTQFLQALGGGSLPSFRKKHRDLDLLLIDDVQFFAGKRATRDELLHTIDTISRGGRQLVLAADRSPLELIELGPEFASRVSGGLACGIDLPDFAGRLGILKRFRQRASVAIPDDVLELIASRLDSDARRLAGAVNRLEAAAEAYRQPVTRDGAERLLDDLFQAGRRPVRVSDVQEAVGEVFGLPPEALGSNSKSPSVSRPRMLAMWLARKHTRAAFSEIGRHFGRRSHSTVISAEKKVNRQLAAGEKIPLSCGECSLEEVVRRIEARLRRGA